MLKCPIHSLYSDVLIKGHPLSPRSANFQRSTVIDTWLWQVQTWGERGVAFRVLKNTLLDRTMV